MRFLLFPVKLLEILLNICNSYYSLKSYSSSTGNVTQRVPFLLFPVELQQFYSRCYTVCAIPIISYRATAQSVHFLLFPVELQQIYKRCYTVGAVPSIPYRTTEALQEMLYSEHISYYSLQSFSSSTGEASQCAQYLVFPIELQQLHRRCYPICVIPIIS